MRKLHMLVPVAAVIALAAGTAAFASEAPGVTSQLVAGRTAAPGHDDVPAQARVAAPARIPPVVACNQLATASFDFSTVPGAATVIISATETTFNGARYCQVYGYIAPQQQFQLELPVTTYIGRYVQEGCDGFCSGIRHDIPPLGGSCPRVTGNELAIGADNQGHVAASETDALWAKDDPQLRVSFGYAAPHALAQAAKAIIAAYYGKLPAYSYYDGCSDGGHEALTEAQRYPHDFNGILAGSPGNIEAQLLAVVPAWVIDVNTGAHGREILTSEKLPALHEAVVKACGNAHGLIEDPRACGFNPAALRCPPGVNNPSCLTVAQVQVVRELYLGPNDGHRHYLYPGGEPYGSELAWANGEFIAPSTDTHWPADTAAYQIGINDLKYAAYWHNPPASYQLKDFHVTVADYRKLLPLAGIYDATDPDLSAFHKADGKLIIWQGWADQAISPFGTVDYYKAVVQDAGGFRASQGFSRLYMIPGQYHCLAGGSPAVTDNPDLLAPLMRWAERGIPPGTITFPLVHPTATIRAISVHPLNPLNPPPGGTRGLNTRYHWIGRFRPGDELWCRTQRMNLACTHHRPGPATRPAAAASRN